MVDLNDLIGKPFQRGARGPDKYDCQSLTAEVFRRFGIPFPDVDISGLSLEGMIATFNRELKYHIEARVETASVSR